MSSTATPTPRGGRRRGGGQDAVVRAATGAVGGPRGRYAASVDAGRRRRVLVGWFSLGACLTIALGFLQKSHCVRYGWAAPEAYWKACYSDLPTYATQSGLLGGALPYGEGMADVMAQPVGTGVVAWVLSLVVPADGLERQQGFFIAWTVLAAVCLIVTVAAVAFANHSRPEWAAHVALAPVVVTVALVAPDLAAIALMSVAIWAWSRDRPVAAGIALGLAVSTRTLPVLVLFVLGGLALRAGAVRPWARMAGTTLLTVVVVLGAATVFVGTTTLTAYQVWATSGAELGSPWYLATLAGNDIAVGTLTVLTVLGWALALSVGLLLTLSAEVRPRLGEIALVVVVIVLITGKALPVQAALWLLPFVALAGLKWRDHLVWAATEVVSFVAVWLYLGGLADPATALPTGWYAFFLLLRIAGMSWLVVVAVRAMRARRVEDHPDDAAGPIARRRDSVVVRYTTRRGEAVDGLRGTSARRLR